jgi:hypothetical protein
MRALIGIIIFICGISALLWARPRDGRMRSFVGTQFEVPFVLAILGALTVGSVLVISGLVPEKG